MLTLVREEMLEENEMYFQETKSTLSTIVTVKTMKLDFRNNTPSPSL